MKNGLTVYPGLCSGIRDIDRKLSRTKTSTPRTLQCLGNSFPLVSDWRTRQAI